MGSCPQNCKIFCFENSQIVKGLPVQIYDNIDNKYINQPNYSSLIFLQIKIKKYLRLKKSLSNSNLVKLKAINTLKSNSSSNNNILSLFSNLSTSINASTSFQALESGSTNTLNQLPEGKEVTFKISGNLYKVIWRTSSYLTIAAPYIKRQFDKISLANNDVNLIAPSNYGVDITIGDEDIANSIDMPVDSVNRTIDLNGYTITSSVS